LARFLNSREPESYQFFQKPSSQVYQHLTPVRGETSFEKIGGLCGSASVAASLFLNDPSARLGLMFAANSGLPGGGLASLLELKRIPKNYNKTLQHFLTVKTQEESLLAAVLLAGLSLFATESEKKGYLKQALGMIAGMWGLVEPVGESKDTMTLQGIDFTKSETPEDYSNAHVVQGKFVVSPIKFTNSGFEISADIKCPLQMLVFADSINANPKIGTMEGSMQRTLNHKAIHDYDFFKECVKAKLAASLDAMADGKATHAVLAPLSLGIYAGKHKGKFHKDYFELLQEVLDEPVGPSGELRGTYFERVVFPEFA
jgi:hypothetical protein